MLKVGLTGGVGSGKSVVTDFFAELGAEIVDTDVVARKIVEPGSDALNKIREHFGDAVISADGSLDRRALRKKVFADPEARKQLEAILHPRIRLETLRQVDAIDAPYVIIVVPLLVETRFDKLVDRVAVVDCGEELQKSRLMARDDIGHAEAESMIRAQVGRQDRLDVADDIIDNSGPIDATQQQVELLHRKYLAEAKHCSEQQAPAE